MLFEVSQNELIEKTAQELKKVIHMPSWSPFVKTGVHKQRPPIDNDWWYVRAAAVLRKIYVLGPIGVSKLRTLYGGRKNRGVKPERFYRGSGSVIRKILQQLEEAKLIKQDVKGKHKGRVITPKGKSLLFSVAKSIKGAAPQKKPKPEKTEEKKTSETQAKPEKKVEEKPTPKTEEKKAEEKTPKKTEIKETKNKPKVEKKLENKEDTTKQDN
ncbi:MAG: 30S ribosomal protein S19e [Nanoarchaeota archaeon]|nr:30S ribosomal protein S19e [Nanoarchaeota archaeon]MBU1269235.1 30S ribosomal protein S19e [Nanoarchaeota archaeon]MBU1604921.1 30S ribosomal protein S19e [Nanoarchaeota archaeon]MBU2443511.1 30S ribosomal protein S19e [Nanoarchaeota archaeon]